MVNTKSIGTANNYFGGFHIKSSVFLAVRTIFFAQFDSVRHNKSAPEPGWKPERDAAFVVNHPLGMDPRQGT